MSNYDNHEIVDIAYKYYYDILDTQHVLDSIFGKDVLKVIHSSIYTISFKIRDMTKYEATLLLIPELICPIYGITGIIDTPVIKNFVEHLPDLRELLRTKAELSMKF